MSEFSPRVSPTLVKTLEHAANKAFDAIFEDIMFGDTSTQDDYPVGAVVLNRSGSVVLGEGVANDGRTQTTTGHAEVNAIIDAKLSHDEHLSDGGIVVSTLESCASCMESTAKHLGLNSMIAFVVARRQIEDMGHVNQRSSTYANRPVREIRLTNKELQQKGKILYSNVTRDPKTGITVIDRPSLRQNLKEIGLEYKATV